MSDARRAVLIVSLLATSALTVALGVTDPVAPIFYPTRFLIWNLAVAAFFLLANLTVWSLWSSGRARAQSDVLSN